MVLVGGDRFGHSCLELSKCIMIMSKLSRPIKYQRRQKALKRRLRMEKKMNNNILFSDNESDHEEPIQGSYIMNKEEAIDATLSSYGVCFTQAIESHILEDVLNGTVPDEIQSMVKSG